MGEINMKKENVMIKRDGKWQDIFNYTNTLNSNIVNNIDAIEYIKNKYPMFSSFEFEVDDYNLLVLLPDNFTMTPINGYGIE
jgi:hypothetical protein